MNSLAVLAEFFGTFLLLISIFATGNAFVIGGIITVILFLIGNISEGVLNPAISYVMYLQSKLSLTEFSFYLAIQMLAALSSYTIYRMVA
jgi:glycerol uptake facilitator-like aquaporin